MKVHNLVLVAKFLRQLEKKAHFQSAVLNALLSLFLSLLILAKGIVAAGLVDEDLLVLLLAFDKLIVDLHGLAIEKRRQKWSILYFKLSFKVT